MDTNFPVMNPASLQDSNLERSSLVKLVGESSAAAARLLERKPSLFGRMFGGETRLEAIDRKYVENQLQTVSQLKSDMLKLACNALLAEARENINAFRAVHNVGSRLQLAEILSHSELELERQLDLVKQGFESHFSKKRVRLTEAANSSTFAREELLRLESDEIRVLDRLLEIQGNFVGAMRAELPK